jgi:DNA-directed RNA polymerase I, II, and III subunit RPABC2
LPKRVAAPLTYQLPRYSPPYENEEPDYDPEEPELYDAEGDLGETPAATGIDDIQAGQNPDQLLTHGDRGVVVSGDPAAAASRGKNGAGQKGMNGEPKDKKIANEERTTTPYMTKYERARILGTRALQIR